MRQTLRAYAKVNLALDVVGKRPDGYHEVDMIMQKVGLYDEITVETIDSGIELTTNHGFLPLDERNIAYRAVQLMREAHGIRQGIHVHVEKRIPIAAGLAGGSTDAASVIRGIDRLLALGMTVEEMMILGKKLGADVPFCFLPGAARARGIGERLEPVVGLDDVWMVLTKPNLSVSTQSIYNQLRPEDYAEHPDVEGMIRALEMGNLYEISARLGNVLEKATFRAHPVVAREKQRMIAYGAKGSLMSGSGPTVFGLFNREHRARAAWKNFYRFNRQTYLVKSYSGV